MYAHIFLQPLWTNSKNQEEEAKPVFPACKHAANSLLDSKETLHNFHELYWTFYLKESKRHVIYFFFLTLNQNEK